MPRFKALVTMTLTCEVLVDAANAKVAHGMVEAMEPPDFLDCVIREEIEIDAVGRVRTKPAAEPRDEGEVE